MEGTWNAANKRTIDSFVQNHTTQFVFDCHDAKCVLSFSDHDAIRPHVARTLCLNHCRMSKLFLSSLKTQHANTLLSLE